MNAQEKKLIEAIIKNSTITKGRESIGKDKVKYRYDAYNFKYSSAFNSLVNQFEKLAGVKKLIQIDEYSIYYDRPLYKGQVNGNFRMTKLIENL